MKSIIQPYLTEKSTQHIGTGLYVFLVHPRSNKTTIGAELKALYNVDVVAVRITNLPAERVMFKRKPGVRSARRKAYVQLPPKQKIPGFESLLEKDKKDAKAQKEEKN